MINITRETHPDLYFDYRKTLNFLGSIKEEDYEYPEEVTNFHVYTEARSPKELEAIKSYIATQNLDKTKLTVWSEYDISEQENIQPYKDIVDLKVYSADEVSEGTPLEGNSKYTNVSDDDRHWMSSGIMRFLVLYKFGGIYMDMDMILLRDFKPILDQNFAYQWGSSMDFAKERRWEPDCHGPCAAMLGAVKGSEYIESCMEQLLRTPIRTRTTCFDEDMLGPVYAKNPNAFTVFPSPFFDCDWLVSKVDEPLSREAEAAWFENPTDPSNLFLESFAWHWHNSSNKHKTIVEGSKFSLLKDRNDKVLKEMGII